MSHHRRIGLLVVIAVILGLAPDARAERCARHGADSLRADATRATQWNWGWAGIYAASALGSVGLALAVDDEDRQFAMWVGAAKSTIGVGYQIFNPIRIEGPEADCHGLDEQLARAARTENKRHNWFPHAGTVALNLAAFALVAYQTGDYFLSASGAVIGIAAGELAIATSPNRVRANGLGESKFHLLPQLSTEAQGLVLGGVF